MNIRDTAIAAFELLTSDLKRQIGPEAIPVLRTAIEQQRDASDPLVDGTIDRALAAHGIDKEKNPTQYAAYRRMLIGHFTFGTEAVAKRQQKRQQAGGRN